MCAVGPFLSRSPQRPTHPTCGPWPTALGLLALAYCPWPNCPWPTALGLLALSYAVLGPAAPSLLQLQRLQRHGCGPDLDAADLRVQVASVVRAIAEVLPAQRCRRQRARARRPHHVPRHAAAVAPSKAVRHITRRSAGTARQIPSWAGSFEPPSHAASNGVLSGPPQTTPPQLWLCLCTS